MIKMIEMHEYLLEICVDNIESAVNAEKGGADRIELCQALEVGGLTPSAGLVRLAKQSLKIPVFMLIRPRSGNFDYSKLELLQMEEDIRSGMALGVDGFVTGAVRNGKIDKEACRRLIKAAHHLPVTFHRAFDVVHYDEALNDVIDLGFKRILTSGGETTAINGMNKIRELVEKADSRIIIMPGSGISERNLRELMSHTSAREYHSSAQGPLKLYLGEAVVRGTTSYPLSSSTVVRAMKTILSS